MHAFLLSVASLAATAAPPSPGTPVAAAPPAAPTIGAWPGTPPPSLHPALVSEPDWNDYNLYPPVAAQLGQEGRVVAELIVGTDGVPRACRVAISSGHAELDDGTCRLMLQMRFKPPRDATGAPCESLFRRGITWNLTEQTGLAPARMTARLRLRGGTVVDCAIEALGPVPSPWTRRACTIFRQGADYYFAAPGLRDGAAAVTAVVELVPDGSAALPPPSQGRLVAIKRTEFEVTPSGDPSACRITREEGLGSTAPFDDHGNPCGYLVASSWFELPEGVGRAPRGAVEVRIYREDGQ